jgi:hypothetical protein
VDFEIVGPIRAIETIAFGRAIRQLRRIAATVWHRPLAETKRESHDCAFRMGRSMRLRFIGTRLMALAGEK